MISSVIGWIISGLIIGLIGRLLYPGANRMGIGSTIILGIMGSLLGGGLAFMLRLGATFYEPGGWIMSVIGSILLLWLGVFGTRPRTTY